MQSEAHGDLSGDGRALQHSARRHLSTSALRHFGTPAHQRTLQSPIDQGVGDGDFAAQLHSTRRAQRPGGGRDGLRDHSSRTHARRHPAGRAAAGRARHAVVAHPSELERELRRTRREGPDRDAGLVRRRQPLRVQAPVGSHGGRGGLAGRAAVAGDARLRVERDPRCRPPRRFSARAVPWSRRCRPSSCSRAAHRCGAPTSSTCRSMPSCDSTWTRWRSGRAAPA